MQIAVIGASVRSAVQALARHPLAEASPPGQLPPLQLALAVDLFADVDTQAAWPGRCHRLNDWQNAIDQLSRLTTAAASVHWLVTGGLDLEAPLLAWLDDVDQRILGNSLSGFAFCKSPERWGPVLRDAGQAVPDFHYHRGVPASGCWFLKSAWPDSPAPWFWQRRHLGQLGSALFMAAAGRADLIGCCRQYVRPDYQYLGNLACHDWPAPQVQTQLRTIGQQLAAAADLRGLFGVDFVLNRQLWPIEINPRPTASVEVLARLLGRNLYAEHVQVTLAAHPRSPATSASFATSTVLTKLLADSNVTDAAEPQLLTETFLAHSDRHHDTDVRISLPPEHPEWVGKRIVYNHREHIIVVESLQQDLLRQWSAEIEYSLPTSGSAIPLRWSVADVPQAGVQIAPGQPLCTLLCHSLQRQPTEPCLAAALWAGLAHLEESLLQQLSPTLK